MEQKILYEDKIRNILKRRGISSDDEIRRFLNPSIDDFHDPFLLNFMKEACERINLAIDEKQTVLIYGDYDADGICSVSMLYLFLKSKGLEPIAFIPNRHTDGYGLSEDTIELIVNTYFPDLIITVDTGISAFSEIEELKDCGIDVIVTDHHEPPENIPQCIVVDPKIQGQDYPFNGLSGAGVVFKLIQAMSGLEEAIKYIDICAISTIGDIVPLLDENRIITKLGLEKINDKNCRPSIAYLKKYLKLDKLSSTDVTFKIVPRLNASGRMDSAFKGFEFMIGEDEDTIKNKFNEIELDNSERLKQSQDIQLEVNEELKNLDFNSEPAIFIRNDSINLGLIGIIASKLCSQFNRPVFIFSKDESGHLKASIRSIEGINIFEILDKYRNLLIDVGGHSLAGGLTIAEDNYIQFKAIMQGEIKQLFDNLEDNDEIEYDEEITEKEISLEFVEAIEKLEPFGFQNPKPVFLLKGERFYYYETKSFKHFKIVTPTRKEIMSFFGVKYAPYFRMKGTKKLYFSLERDTFFKTPKVKAMLKTMTSDITEIYKAKQYSLIKSLERKYREMMTGSSVKNVIKFKNLEESKGLLNSKSGTLFITDDFNLFNNLSKEYKLKANVFPLASGQTALIYNPTQCIDYNCLVQYNNLVFLDGCRIDGEFNSLRANVLVQDKAINQNDIDCTRETFAKYYKQLMSKLPTAGNDLIEVAELVCAKEEFSLLQMAFTILVCAELGFIDLTLSDVCELKHIDKKEKKDLSTSELMKLFLNK